MHDRQKLSDIIGAQAKFLVENLRAVCGMHPLVFHHARVAAAGRIHADAFPDYLLAPIAGGGRFFLLWRRRAALGDMVGKALAVSSFGGFFAFKGFISGIGIALYLGLAGIPRIVDAGGVAFPNGIVFFLFGHGRFGLNLTRAVAVLHQAILAKVRKVERLGRFTLKASEPFRVERLGRLKGWKVG